MATHSSTLAWKIPWTEEPGKLQSMGRSESDMSERLHFYFSLSCIGEGNGNPLQSSCLENPRDGGAWWAAIYGVTQSWTRLKRLSSSSSNKVLQTGWFKTTEMCCLRVLGATSLKAWCSWGHGPTVQFGSVAQSCPTPSDPMDCSLPSSSVHGIFQARVLE